MKKTERSLKQGTRVRLTACAKHLIRAEGGLAHDYTGYVIGPIDYGMGLFGEEIDVRWPRLGRQAYPEAYLEKTK